MVAVLCVLAACGDTEDPEQDDDSAATTGGPATSDGGGSLPGASDGQAGDGSTVGTSGIDDSGDGGSDDGCVSPQCGDEVVCGVFEACGQKVDCGPCQKPTTIDQLEPEHLVADPTRNRFYVTVQAAAPSFANELVVIDPATAVTVDSVFVGSNPSSMAISADHSTLWVGLDGSFEIIEVDLTTPSPTPGPSYPLPPSIQGDLAAAGPMVVLPGTTDSVAVSLHRFNVSPSFAGVAILDAGVPRPILTPGHTGAARLTGGPDGWLFGFNNLHTGYEFWAIEVLADGPAQSEYSDLVDGFQTDITYADGFVFATSGQVVDVSNPAAPWPAGTFPFSGAVLPQPELGRVLMLSPPDFDSATALRVLSPETFTEVGYAEILAEVGDAYFYDLATTDGTVLGVISLYFNASPRLQLITNPFPG